MEKPRSLRSISRWQRLRSIVFCLRKIHKAMAGRGMKLGLGKIIYHQAG